MSDEALWKTVIVFAEYPFRTMMGVLFSYDVKIGRDGTPNKELQGNRREESQTIAWSSILLTFEKALEMRGEMIRSFKQLGDIHEISYIYPMLFQFGIIEVSEETATNMMINYSQNR